ncbi:MAG: TonB family protein [Moraxella sp.]|nr:TonB family protein [Moraxella sp.]
MQPTTSTTKPTYTMIAAAVLAVFTLHGAAMYGLGQMQAKPIVLPKPKPIEIEFVQIQEKPKEVPLVIADEVVIPVNQPKVVTRSAVTPIPPPAQATRREIKSASTPPKMFTQETQRQPVKSEVPKTEAPKADASKTETPKTESSNTNTSINQTSKILSNHKQSQGHTVNIGNTGAAGGKTASAGATSGTSGKGTGNGASSGQSTQSSAPKGSGTGASGGNTGGSQLGAGGGSYTITNANASWKRKPNLSFANAYEYNPKTTSVSATISVDASGKITSVSVSSTGDRALDREIVRRIKQYSLNPHLSGGQAVSGKVTISLSLSGFSVKKDNKKQDKKESKTAKSDKSEDKAPKTENKKSEEAKTPEEPKAESSAEGGSSGE